MLELLEKFSKKLPKFPDGRIDYRNSKEAAVVSVFVMCGNELLLLKRSDRVGNYKGRWNVAAGYFDELKSPEEKALEELKEETGINSDQILKIKPFPHFKLIDSEIGKIFYTFPVLILLDKKPEIKLDWEHTEFKWINPKDLSRFETVYGLEEILAIVKE